MYAKKVYKYYLPNQESGWFFGFMRNTFEFKQVNQKLKNSYRMTYKKIFVLLLR